MSLGSFAHRRHRGDAELVLILLVQILHLVAGLIRRQRPLVPFPLRVYPTDMNVVRRDVPVAPERRLPGHDNRRRRPDHRLHAGGHLGQVLLGDAVQRRGSDPVPGPGRGQHLDRVVGVLLEAVDHHGQGTGDLRLRLGRLGQHVHVLPYHLVALQDTVQARVGGRVPRDLKGLRGQRCTPDVLRRAARHCGKFPTFVNDIAAQLEC